MSSFFLSAALLLLAGTGGALTPAVLANNALPDEAHFTPFGGEVIVNQSLSYSQKTPKVAVSADGGQLVVAWASAVPLHDIFLRRFDAAGVPLGPEVQVNSTLSNGLQDEPVVALDEDGNVLVAWSDRAGYDGFQMGIFGRAFRADGSPWSPEFQINVAWQQSQWEPFVAARPGGGFVVCWSGQDDGDSFMRLLAGDGTPVTGEIEVNTFKNNAQIDPVPAVAPDGRTFVAWIDFGGYGGPGTGTNIFARQFDAAGVPLQPVEFLVNQNSLPGEQREPKTAADGLGRFYVVWEDRQSGPDGVDIMLRRYGHDGLPLGPEFRVNEATAGDQVLPAVAADHVGNVTVAWQDKLTGAILARRFDAQGAALGGDFVVHLTAAGGQAAPDVKVDPQGERFAFVYTTPDVGGIPKTEVGLQLWRHAPVLAHGPLLAGGTTPISLQFPGGGGLERIVLLSLAISPALPLPDGRSLPLAYDPVFAFSLSAPGGGGLFTGFTGTLDGTGQARASITLPGHAALIGATLQAAAITLDLGATGLAQQLRHVTHPVALPIE